MTTGFFRRRDAGSSTDDPIKVSPELAAEFERSPNWMYRWDLGGGKTTPALSDHLQLIHQTRLELLQDPVREALAAAGPEASAIDLSCWEGWFTHRLLELGAARAVGVDVGSRASDAPSWCETMSASTPRA